MKSEIKIEFTQTKELRKLIEKSYFEKGYKGKLISKNNFIEINEKSNLELFSTLRGLNNATIKVSNQEIIDGNCRFIVDDTGENPRIYPISMYCITDDNKKFIFY